MYELNMIYESFIPFIMFPKWNKPKLFPQYNESSFLNENTHIHSLRTQLDYLSREIKNKLNISLLCVCLRGKSVAFVEISMAVRITICWAAVIRWRWTLQTLETPGKFDPAVLTLFRWVHGITAWTRVSSYSDSEHRGIKWPHILTSVCRLCLSAAQTWWSWWRWSSPAVCSPAPSSGSAIVWLVTFILNSHN